MIVLNFDLTLEPAAKDKLETANYWFVKPTNFKATLRRRQEDMEKQ
jgi:hypothetical protein